MKNILLIGVGGTGSRAVNTFYKRYNQFGHNDNHITALVFDTDAGDIKGIDEATVITMADSASVGTICDRIGKKYLREWFPCDDAAIRSQEMVRGASQWRKKSYLAFLNLMNKPLERAKFIQALDKMVADPGAVCEIYVISSVAGGTGSGSFIPIALFAKRYLRKNLGKDPIVNAMIALPEIFADSQTPENRTKIYANAYAILRELNAINLVARNYNAGRTAQKKSPIKFRIGHPEEPNVGVLFDASDKAYWTPEAAPFSQIFLLDKIPGIDSVGAHEIVLANSLYTILCTDIGAAFDSEFSNHELLRSQNNGSNAIFAGVSTSQIRFPRESILDYIAHRKTLDTCDNEWLVLHNKVEGIIREKEQAAKESKRRYTMSDGDYAKIVLDAYEDIEESESNDEVVSLVERGTAIYDKDKKIDKTAVDFYFAELEEIVNSKVPKLEDITKTLEEELRLDGTKPGKEEVIGRAVTAQEYLLKYFQDCVEEIKKVTTTTADSVITLDKRKQEYADGKMAITHRLLRKGDKFINPVAAMVQLCRFRAKLTGAIEKNFEEWKEFRQRKITEIPEYLCMLTEDEADEFTYKASKSHYFKLGAERFIQTSHESVNFTKAMTDTRADNAMLLIDAKTIANNICWQAQSQLTQKVFARIAKDVDTLIEKYRTFFNRFDKEKEDLAESTKSAKLKDAGNIDSAINVFSSVEDKDTIFNEILIEGGPASESEVAATDDVVGKGVFESAYRSAIAAYSGDLNWNDKDSGAYRSLFKNMVDAYREFIGKSEAFVKIASYNVIEAILAACGETANSKEIESAIHSCFSIAQEFAVPSLRIKTDCDETELVQPSNVMVFMISEKTARYIKKQAEKFELKIPADQTKESDVIRSCAEQFIRKYSGNSSARVSIVSSIEDQTLYCTGEIMDITPLRISKFDELGPDNKYYKNYCVSITSSKRYDTDMWNPHIGFDLHKRGYLPYMNMEKENECDKDMVKALFYGLKSGKITYVDGMGEYKGRYFFNYNGTKITDPEKKLVNNKNIAQLVAWIRNEADLVEEWSAAFDKDIETQMAALPSIASDNVDEIRVLEASMTKMPFMQLLTDSLYVDPSESTKKTCRKIKFVNGKLTEVERRGPTIFEFAYMVKTSEEIGRDCDDAERILEVAYEVFKTICEYRTNPVNAPEKFIQIYRQQLNHVYKSIAGSKIICASGSNCEAYLNNLVTWLNRANLFTTISTENPMDEKGNISISFAYNYKTCDDVMKILKYIASNFKEDLSELPEELLIETAVATTEETPVETPETETNGTAADSAE